MALVVLLAVVTAAAADRTGSNDKQKASDQKSHDSQKGDSDNGGAQGKKSADGEHSAGVSKETESEVTESEATESEATESEATESVGENEADELEEEDAIESLTSPTGPLYEIKIIFEDLDEAFTVNATDRLNKKLAHAEERLAEANRMARQGKASAVGRVLSHYEEEIGDIESTDSTAITEKGLEIAYTRIQNHEFVLRGVLANMTSAEAVAGLQNALSNSERLEKKFMDTVEKKKLEEKNRDDLREDREKPGKTKKNPAGN
ncbi:MAG TPA: hypothetical protein HA257_10100 [Candidatus Methanoperedenaceae archaeon]|nr:hypothetical protein [Candidatus Methanoperedenaceae archaeon]